ncbi:MAG: hypothetical protein LBK56_10820 [Gracilibacteraceae bacterium]|jgi:hypothetical protein|nr:hypothetical protein [Gracilibacteraceae bacterium]
MKTPEDIIIQKFNAMRGGEDKALLREIVNEALLPLCAETRRQYEALAERVRSEVTMPDDSLTCAHTVLPRGAADSSHPFLRPLLPDVDGSDHISAEALQSAQTDAPLPWLTVFYAGDALAVKRIRANAPLFPGLIKAEGKEHSCRFRLIPCRRYAEAPRRIYEAFVAGGLPWRTLPLLYLDKFFDLAPVDAPPIKAPDGLPAGSVSVDFGPETERFRRDLIPVWNIDRVTATSTGFPKPALDKLNYEYNFDLADLGTEHAYLIAEAESVSAARRESGSLVVVSAEPKALKMDMYRFFRVKEDLSTQYPYPLVSNESRSLRLRDQARLRTPAELRSVISSYALGREMELDSFALLKTAAGETYDLDGFLRDEIRDRTGLKTLLLRFKTARRDFLSRDIMSFLTSAVQLHFPEYQARGVLI